jgi:flagellar basal body-associated protein FliL
MVRIILILLIIGTHILAKLTAAAYSSQQAHAPAIPAGVRVTQVYTCTDCTTSFVGSGKKSSVVLQNA